MQSPLCMVVCLCLFARMCSPVCIHERICAFLSSVVGISRILLLFGGRLMSQQHASVCKGRGLSGICTCCHTESEGADKTFYLTQSQCTCTGPASLSADPKTPGAWQGSHWSATF